MGGTGEQTKEETSPTESGTVANTKPPGRNREKHEAVEARGREEVRGSKGGAGMGWIEGYPH